MAELTSHVFYRFGRICIVEGEAEHLDMDINGVVSCSLAQFEFCRLIEISTNSSTGAISPPADCQ